MPDMPERAVRAIVHAHAVAIFCAMPILKGVHCGLPIRVLNLSLAGAIPVRDVTSHVVQSLSHTLPIIYFLAFMLLPPITSRKRHISHADQGRPLRKSNG
jgi:hypothetical protein